MTFRTRSALAALALAAVTSGVAQTPRGPQPSPPARSGQPSPRDLYHRGARQFIDGEKAAALASVEAGLAQAPDDARLRALRDLIRQQQDEQDNQDGGQQDQDAQNQEGGDQGQQGDQGEGDQGRDESEQDDQPPADEPEAQRDQTNTAPPRSTAPGQAPPQSGQTDEMTAAQADRILDAVGGEERLLLREMRRAPTQRRRSDKDW